MIISDLEYLESAENSQLQGGCYAKMTDKIKTQADDDFQAFGDETDALTPFIDTSVNVADAKVGRIREYSKRNR